MVLRNNQYDLLKVYHKDLDRYLQSASKGRLVADLEVFNVLVKGEDTRLTKPILRGFVRALYSEMILRPDVREKLGIKD